MLVLDVDNGTEEPRPDGQGFKKVAIEHALTPATVFGLLSQRGIAGLIYTSWSNAPDWPRFRVVLPLSEPVAPDDWRTVVSNALTSLGLDPHRAALDLKSTRDPAHLYFLPTVNDQGVEPEFFETEGEFLSPCLMPPDPPLGGQIEDADFAQGTEQWWRSCHRDLRSLNLAALLHERGLEIGLPHGEDEHRRVRCPWDQEHSTSGGLDAWIHHEEGRFPFFGCSHNRCEGRRLRDVCELVGWDRVAEKCLRPFEPWDDSAEREEILVTTDMLPVVNKGIAALASLGGVYQRGEMLVHVPAVKTPNLLRSGNERARIVLLPDARLEEMLSEAARWFEVNDQGKRTMIRPRGWIVRAILARGAWPELPYLKSIAGTPILRPDGTVLQGLGYDEKMHLLYLPDGDFLSVPEAPTRADAQAAARSLLDVVQDFPFDADCHKAAYLAALLTPFARPAIEEPVPFFLIEANIRGAGKTLLADTISFIVTGHGFPRMSQVKNEDEEEKRLVGVAMEGTPMVLLDNLSGSFGSPCFAGMLTSSRYKGRILGKSGNPEFPIVTTWYGTGNNIQLVEDVARRTVPIRLKSPLECPENRGDFTHEDLLRHVRGRRPELVQAALVILRAYMAAGSPPQALKPFGSFTKWSDLVRSAVSWAYGVDPCLGRDQLNTTGDLERSALEALVEGWRGLFPDGRAALVSEAVERVEGAMDQHRALVEALDLLCPGRKAGVLPSTASVGKLLRKFEQRVVLGSYFMRAPGSGKHGHRWMLKSVDPETPGVTRPAAGGQPAVKLTFTKTIKVLPPIGDEDPEDEAVVHEDVIEDV